MTELEIMLDEALNPRRAGEWELKKHLRKLGHTVLDVSNEPYFWKKDIDFILDDNYTLEIKWDNVISTTGNLFIETCSDMDNKKQGWFMFCEADYLFYGDAEKQLFYVFSFSELKQHIEAYKKEYKKRYAADYGRDGVKKWSYGYLVPLESVKHLVCQVVQL